MVGDAPLRIAVSRSHKAAFPPGFLRAVSGSEWIEAGSSLKFCLLAAGEIDLYPRLGRTMEWDTAAGDAILRACGGRTVTLDSADLVYDKRGQGGDSDFANPFFVSYVDPAVGARAVQGMAQT